MHICFNKLHFLSIHLKKIWEVRVGSYSKAWDLFYRYIKEKNKDLFDKARNTSLKKNEIM